MDGIFWKLLGRLMINAFGQALHTEKMEGGAFCIPEYVHARGVRLGILAFYDRISSLHGYELELVIKWKSPLTQSITSPTPVGLASLVLALFHHLLSRSLWCMPCRCGVMACLATRIARVIWWR